LYQKSWKFDKEIQTLFVDFKKAYDSILRENLLNIMKKISFSTKTGQFGIYQRHGDLDKGSGRKFSN
jgi:purine nucleoside phosphorylase